VGNAYSVQLVLLRLDNVHKTQKKNRIGTRGALRRDRDDEGKRQNPIQLTTFIFQILLIHLSGHLSGIGAEGTVVIDQADVGTIGDKATLLSVGSILLTVELGESPLLGHDNLLSSRELEGSTAGSLNDVLGHVVLATDREDDLSNLDTGNDTVGLSESTTHSSLESIGSGARKHLVDTDYVPWVHSHTHVEVFLGSHLDNVLVAANTGSFKGFRGQLLSL